MTLCDSSLEASRCLLRSYASCALAPASVCAPSQFSGTVFTFATNRVAAGRRRAKRAHVARRRAIARWKRLGVSYIPVPVARLRRLACAHNRNFSLLPFWDSPKVHAEARTIFSCPISLSHDFLRSEYFSAEGIAHLIKTNSPAGEGCRRGAASRKARAHRAEPHGSLLEAPRRLLQSYASCTLAPASVCAPCQFFGTVLTFATQHVAAGRRRAKRTRIARRRATARWKRLGVSYNPASVARLRRLAFARPLNFSGPCSLSLPTVSPRGGAAQSARTSRGAVR